MSSSAPPYPFQELAASRTLSSSPLPANADWPPIDAFKLYTLVFVLPKEGEDGEGQKVLLGLKQRGAFTGIWNGFGGKVERSDPSVLHAAVRELEEEAGIRASNMRYRGRIVFGGAPDEVSIDMRLFSCSEWEGEITASEEMGMPVCYSTVSPATPPLPPPASTRTSPQPAARQPASTLPALPTAAMHPDAHVYLPLLFAGKSLVARFDYGTLKENADRGSADGLRGWWIGELEEGATSSGAESAWPPPPSP